MQQTFLIFLRGNVYYYEDTRDGGQHSLHTRDKADARRLINAKNESVHNPAAVNLQIERTHITASSPEVLTRTWMTLCVSSPDAVSQLLGLKIVMRLITLRRPAQWEAKHNSFNLPMGMNFGGSSEFLS
jgi:hypothetical protein